MVITMSSDESTQIELDEPSAKQLEAARGLMAYQNNGEVPSDENVVQRALAFYLDEYDVVRSDDGDDDLLSPPSGFQPPSGSLTDTGLQLGPDPNAKRRGRDLDD